jgi:hypothetical protein
MRNRRCEAPVADRVLSEPPDAIARSVFPRLHPMYRLKHILALGRRSIAIPQVRSSLPQVSLQQSGSVANYHPPARNHLFRYRGSPSLQQSGGVAIIACRDYARLLIGPPSLQQSGSVAEFVVPTTKG